MTFADQVWSEDDQRKLREAFDEVYATIEKSREFIREGLDGPLTMACQFQAVQEKVDQAEKLVDGLVFSLREVGQMAEVLRAQRDNALQEIVLAAAEAYAQGWQDRFAALLETMPASSADVIAWLSAAVEGHTRTDPAVLAEVLSTLKVVLEIIKQSRSKG